MAHELDKDIILEIDNLHVSFKQEARTVYAVNGASLTVGRGEIVGIVGESGCGKSVTAQSVVRLVPCPPGRIDKGSILVRCGDIVLDSAKLDPKGDAIRRLRGRYVSVIFQEPMRSLHPMYTVGWQIIEGLFQHMRISQEEGQQRAIGLLEQVGIAEPQRVFKTFPHQLSGGMRQRAMIAIACACNPELLIADEPTTALDVTIQAQILDLLRSLQRERKMSILLITHDLGVIADMADRVVVMYLGKVVEIARAADLFENPLHPYTQGLIASVPTLTTTHKARLHSLSGTVKELTGAVKGCVFERRCSQRMDICAKETPPTIDTNGHCVACWLYRQTEDENRSAI